MWHTPMRKQWVMLASLAICSAASDSARFLRGQVQENAYSSPKSARTLQQRVPSTDRHVSPSCLPGYIDVSGGQAYRRACAADCAGAPYFGLESCACACVLPEEVEPAELSSTPKPVMVESVTERATEGLMIVVGFFSICCIVGAFGTMISCVFHHGFQSSSVADGPVMCMEACVDHCPQPEARRPPPSPLELECCKSPNLEMLRRLSDAPTKAPIYGLSVDPPELPESPESGDWRLSMRRHSHTPISTPMEITIVAPGQQLTTPPACAGRKVSVGSNASVTTNMSEIDALAAARRLSQASPRLDGADARRASAGRGSEPRSEEECAAKVPAGCRQNA